MFNAQRRVGSQLIEAGITFTYLLDLSTSTGSSTPVARATEESYSPSRSPLIMSSRCRFTAGHSLSITL